MTYRSADKSLAQPTSRCSLMVRIFRLMLVLLLLLLLLLFTIIIGIQPLGRFGQRPELSQATGMALVRCILGKFLGVVCQCFPPRLDVPTFTTRCLHVRHNARDLSSFVLCIYTYIYSTNIPPIMIINRIHENQNLLSL